MAGSLTFVLAPVRPRALVPRRLGRLPGWASLWRHGIAGHEGGPHRHCREPEPEKVSPHAWGGFGAGAPVASRQPRTPSHSEKHQQSTSEYMRMPLTLRLRRPARRRLLTRPPDAPVDAPQVVAPMDHGNTTLVADRLLGPCDHPTARRPRLWNWLAIGRAARKSAGMARMAARLARIGEERGTRRWRCKWSGKRDLNPRPQPWQGCALPLSYSRSTPGF
jgi:hypothetical protein